MERLFRLIERIGHATLPVLVLGETGAGKEIVAEWIHRCSKLATQPFLRINCAGLTESVVESELFGHERGAFTGATQTTRGLFEAADGGTLLLDEVAELPLRTQAKLLRVLEAGEFTRLGSTSVRKVNVRFVAATHRPLPELVAAGVFRRDLYYRLNGAKLEVPPLRERRSEILPLAELFLERATAAGGRRARLDESAKQALLGHFWPGNVRELRNVIEYAAALCRDGVIDSSLLALELPSVVPAPPPHEGSISKLAQSDGGLKHELKSFERRCIEAALARCEGNQTRAARELGVSRRTLTNKLTEHGLDRPRKAYVQAAPNRDGGRGFAASSYAGGM